jgi:hypothetical protein
LLSIELEDDFVFLPAAAHDAVAHGPAAELWAPRPVFPLALDQYPPKGNLDRLVPDERPLQDREDGIDGPLRIEFLEALLHQSGGQQTLAAQLGLAALAALTE